MIEELVRLSYDEGRILRIDYQPPNLSLKSTERDIDVYAFDDTYIDAYCRLRKEKRSFRIDRIKSASLLEEEFHRDPDIEYRIKLSGMSKQAQECQRPCCRLGLAHVARSEVAASAGCVSSQPIGVFQRILKFCGLDGSRAISSAMIRKR